MISCRILAIFLMCSTAVADGPLPAGTRFTYQGQQVTLHGLHDVRVLANGVAAFAEPETSATPAASTDGPLFSIWHIDGHGYAWQQSQVDAGLPMEPTIRVPAFFENTINLPNTVGALNNSALLLSQMDGGPLSLRMNNITNDLDYATPRLVPLTEDNAGQSFLSVRRLADGTLDQTPVPSPWATNDAWTTYGNKLATAAWTVRLQEIIPNPTSVILRENNEGPKRRLAELYREVRVRWVRTDNNTLQFADASTPREKWVDENRQPLVGEWMSALLAPNNLTAYQWKSPADLDAIDIRAEAWVAPRRSTLPSATEADFIALMTPKYRALFNAFRDGLSPAWKAVWKGCCGYSTDPFHDADSPPTYTNYYADRPASLCHPQWAVTRDKFVTAQQPKAWREISIRMHGQTMFQAVQDGTGAIVDAESYAGFNVHWAWALQSAGKPVRLVWWDNYNTPVTQVVPAAQSNKDKLIQYGRPDLTSLTIEQCEVAVMQRLKQIHDSPLLSEYWKRGTTRIMSSPLNTSTVTKVYATETTIPGVTAKLVCCYTPCDLIGVIQVEGLLLPAKRLGYYLDGAPTEVVE